MYGEEQRRESTTELPQEATLRSIPVSVKAAGRLRSASGAALFPSSSGRVRSSDSTSSTSSIGSLGGNRARSGSIARQWAETTLYLTETTLYYEALGQVCTVLLEDLIGVQVLPKPPPNNPNACEFDINYYPKVFRRGGEKTVRKLISVTVQFDSEPVFKDNLFQAVDWKKAINIQTQRTLKKTFHNADVNALQLNEDESVLVPRHLLVFLNPVSGSGKTVSDFKQHIQPLFDLAEIHYQLIITERQNHAREIMKSFDVTSIHGIVISSGDGLLYEVVNGLMEREDWEMAIKVPIGMLPTGSGNALVASTLHESEEEFSLLNAAFQIIRGGVIPMDIATVETGDGGKSYMSLLANWGLVADVDIESEKFRKIGETRFVLGALNCIIKRRLYSGKLSYLPWVDDQSATHTSENTDSLEQSDKAKPEETESSSREKQNNVTLEDQQVSKRLEDIHVHVANATATSVEQPGTQVVDTANTSSAPTDHNNETSTPISKSETKCSTSDDTQQPQEECKKVVKQFGPKADLLSPLPAPIPENWKTFEREFLAVTFLMIPHMAHNFFGDPQFSIGSGKIRIVICDGQITRVGMFGLLTKADTGEHLEIEGVHRIDTRAFRLEPLTSPGMLTIDGEPVHYGPIQCQIQPSLARVMCRKRQ